MFKKIAVALDGSESARQALEIGLKLAEAEHAELGVCSVVDPIAVEGSAPLSPAVDTLVGHMEIEARRIVADALDEAHRRGLVATGSVRTGSPYVKILDFAREFAADAIVMGTHGRSGLSRLVMGSVAEAVLRASPVPVVIVRERESRAAKSADA